MTSTAVDAQPSPATDPKTLLPISYDGVSHHALGGGSYAFKENYPEYLSKLLTNGPKVEINLIIQSNSSPHLGTMTSVALAFALATHPRELGLQPYIMFDLWDNAKGEQLTIDGVAYQRGLRDTGKLFANLEDYHDIFQSVHSRLGGGEVPYQIRMEEEFLSHPRMPSVVGQIIRDRETLGLSLAPTSGKLALRAACTHTIHAKNE